VGGVALHYGPDLARQPPLSSAAALHLPAAHVRAGLGFGNSHEFAKKTKQNKTKTRFEPNFAMALFRCANLSYEVRVRYEANSHEFAKIGNSHILNRIRNCLFSDRGEFELRGTRVRYE
jgi:hypothetical protein